MRISLLMAAILILPSILCVGCATDPHFPQPLPKHRYAPITAGQLTTEALVDQFENKYVVFDAEFLTFLDKVDLSGYKKHWLQFLVDVEDQFYRDLLIPNDRCGLLVEMDQVVEGTLPLIRIYGQTTRATDTDGHAMLYTKVHMIEVLQGSSGQARRAHNPH